MNRTDHTIHTITIADIKSEHPDNNWNAQWIWDSSAAKNIKNTWVSFRKKFTLARVPGQCTAKLAAESRYWLYVNGNAVVFDGGLKRGPTPEDGYFDKVDIAPYLVEGVNIIAVKVWYWGIKQNNARIASYSNTSSEKPGFLFEAGDILSDGSWKVKRDGAYLDDQREAQPNYRIPEYNIYYDARLAADGGFEKPEFDDGGWEYAAELGKAPCAPWGRLFERPVPLFKDYGLKEYLNIESYRNYTTTPDKTDKTDETDETDETETLIMRVPYNAQITPYLKIDTCIPGLTIDMTTENSRGSVMSSYITSDAGIQEFEALGWFNGQFVYYKIPAGIKIISLKYRETGYDAEFSGSFKCDDEYLNRLWEMCLRTLNVTMRDNFMDCPDRERAQWWGDAVNEIFQAMYSMAPSAYALFEKGMQTKLGWMGWKNNRWDPAADNVLQTVVPIRADYFELPMQELAGVIGIWDYYMYTGKADFIKMTYEVCRNYLLLWDIGAGGLIEHREGKWGNWGDWGDNVDVPVLENALYYKAMSAVKNMAALLGKDGANGDISLFEQRLEGIKRAFDTFWTPEGYRSGSVPDDRANAMAVLAGLADEAKYPHILSVFKTSLYASPYMEKYVLDAMCEMGCMREAQARIKQRYEPMMNYKLHEQAYTTLWEKFPAAGTKNHAWSGGPMITMSKYMAGIMPLAPGYSLYQIKPCLGCLNMIDAVVHSVKGEIRVRLEKIKQDAETTAFIMNITSPANANISVPVSDFESGSIKINGVLAFEAGAPVCEPDGITYMSADPQYVNFTAAPGAYDITAAACLL